MKMEATCSVFCGLFLLLLTGISITAAAATCATSLSNSVPFPTSPLACSSVWSSNDYTLWFSLDSSTSILSVVLSATQNNQWVGIGFSEDGKMKGSSAMVGFVNATGGPPVIQRYYLADRSPDQVTPDYTQDRLKLNGTPVAWTSGSTLFMAFQLSNLSAESLPYQLYAVGPVGALPDGYVLTQHENMAAVQFDYSTGTYSTVDTDIELKKKAHGIINIFGWGILLPVGAIVARYCRAWDPGWFFVHATFQVIGYLFICAGLGTGVRLDVSDVSGLNSHKALGIFLFVLASFQMLAVLIRPNKDAKNRRYWNWSHWWTGRLALFLAAINVFVGINVANGERSWKAGNAIVVALELITVVAQETLLWIRYLRQPPTRMTTSLSMSRRQSTYPSAPSYPPPAYSEFQ